MTETAEDRAQALLDAHVAYVLRRLEGGELPSFLEQELELLLDEASKIPFEHAVSREMIKATAHAYAIELEPSGAIPELVGDVARTIYAHEAQTTTTFGDLISDRSFDELTEKFLELRRLREWLVHELFTQPAYAELVTHMIVEGVSGFLRSRATGTASELGRMVAARVDRLVGHEKLVDLEEALERAIHEHVRARLEGILALGERILLEGFDEERTREVLRSAWDEIKEQPLASALRTVDSLDVEELFVLAYETWRELRRTDYYRTMIDIGVDGLFDKYGELTLRELLDELGITTEIMRREALRFGPPVLAMFREEGILEPFVRRHLEGFYRSEEALAILARS
ncbi:MAG: hypothetical protein U0230_23445 [Polyangiales bacterium]